MPVKAFSSYPPFGRDSVLRRAIIQKNRVADLCRIMELYEGICVVRTAEPDKGLLEFWISPSFVGDFEKIIEALKHEIPIDIVMEKGDQPCQETE